MELADAILLVMLQLDLWAYKDDMTTNEDNLLLIGQATVESLDYGNPDLMVVGKAGGNELLHSQLPLAHLYPDKLRCTHGGIFVVCCELLQ